MGELHGDEMRQEYEGSKVWVIDDGERHWYVAEHAHEALKFHEIDADCEALTFPNEVVTVELLPPEYLLTIGEGDDSEPWPSHWRIEKDASRGRKATATCAEWATYYRDSIAEGGAQQIATTVV